MPQLDQNPTINKVVLYTAAPWSSALSVIRITDPLSKAGIDTIQGNEGDQVEFNAIADVDAVVIQRDFPRFRESFNKVIDLSKRNKKAIIYEIDDLLFEVPENHVSKDNFTDHLFPMLLALIQADLVTVSSAYLRTYFQPFNPNIDLLPCYLDENLWWSKQEPTINSKESFPVIIGYMGGKTHRPDLEFIAPALEKVLDRYGESVQIVFWGDEPPSSLTRYTNIEWRQIDFVDYSQFVEYFSKQHADIWLAPLVPNQFNRAKSAIKYLEYGAVGGAGIYSRLEPYLEIVRHGVNGFLASDQDEWVYHLQLLIDQPDLRSRLAQSALETTREWGLSKHAYRWSEAYLKGMDNARNPDPDRIAQTAAITQIANQVQKRHDQLELAIQTLWNMVYELQAEKSSLEGQINDIYASRSWRWIQRIQKWRANLFK